MEKPNLLLDLEGGFVITHAFLVANFTEDTRINEMGFLYEYQVGMNLKPGLLYVAGCLFQMVHEGEWIDY